MPELRGIKVDVPDGLFKLTGEAVFDTIEAAVPSAFQPLLVELASTAPVASGKMAAAGFQAVARRVNAGLVQGVEVSVGSGIPYTHLPGFGHDIIGRGPSRKGRKLKRAQRAAMRSALKARRAVGPIGHVPASNWIEPAVEKAGPAVTAAIEEKLATAWGGGS